MSAFTSPPATLELPPDEAHVWLVTLPTSEACDARLRALLLPEEAARVDRVRLPEPKAASLVSRGIRRALLARYLDCDPLVLRFDYGEHEKPSLAGGAWPAFNISHSGPYVVFAVAGTGDIGIDVEVPRSTGNPERIARRYFSEQETATLLALPEPERAAAFLRCFTRKEAFVKALGSGFTFPLRNFDVTLAPGAAAELLEVRTERAAASDWRLVDLPLAGVLDGSGVGALAIDARVTSVRYFTFA